MSLNFQDATDKRLSRLEKADHGLRNLWAASVGSPITGVLAALIFLPLLSSPASADCANVGGIVTCAADDDNGFTSGDITDLTLNEGVTVDDSGGEVAGSGIIDINGDITGTLLNNGVINDATNPDPDDGVNVLGTLNALINNGTISGGNDGIDVFQSLTSLTNSGTITGGEDGIDARNIGTLINSGTISGGNAGIDAPNIGTLINSGTISGGNDGIFSSVDIDSLTNSGTISGGDDGIDVVQSLTSLTNSGTISGGVDGIVATSTITSLTNSGTISGGDDGVQAATLTSLTNSGTINGADYGVQATTLTSLINSGIITGGDDGVRARETLDSLINSGTIQGDTFAIQEQEAGDTSLTLNAGSILIGRVDLGGGTNTLNIGEGLSLNSTFESDGGTTQVGLGTLHGHLVALIPVTGNDNNDVQIVAVDPSTFASFDDALAALTSGIGQTVQGRQSALRSDPALGFASRFAAAAETSLAAFSDLNLDGAPHLNPNRFWIEGFGAYRQDQGDGVGGDFDSLTGGLVAGLDVPLDAITSIGVMAGFSASTAENEIDTQTTDATSYFGGVYASTQAGGIYWDASLTLGYSDYDQERITANNLLPGGLETARADFSGWFINPQITMTREAGNPLAGTSLGALMATSTLEQSLTLSYAGLFMDGYTETGTTNPLTLDDRSVHIASARAALALPFEAVHANGALTTLRLIGGVEARTQFGGDTISGTLLGQAVSTTLDDDDFTGGAFLGLSGEYETTTSLTAYANVEAMLETDMAYQLSATAGVRIAF